MEHAAASHHAAHADFLSSVFSTSNSSETRIQRVSSKASDVSRLSAPRPVLENTVATPDAAPSAQTTSGTSKAKVYFKRLQLKSQSQKELACWGSLFMAGFGDASAGVLIPAMQAHYTASALLAGFERPAYRTRRSATWRCRPCS